MVETINSPATAATSRQALTARALLLGERIDTDGLERADLVSTAPLAFHAGQSGFAVLYRFGVAVLFGLSPLEEDEIVKKIGLRVSGASRGDDETLIIEATPDGEEKALPDGRLAVKDLSEARLLVIADVLAKSVALARDGAHSTGVVAAVHGGVVLAGTRFDRGGRISRGARAFDLSRANSGGAGAPPDRAGQAARATL